MTKTEQSDVVIIGAGLVGSAMALALAKEGLSVTLLERQTRERAFDTRFDGRASAIARSSQYVFEHIGVWSEMLKKAEPINDIRVVDGYSQALVHYDHKKADGNPFGHIIPNTHVLPTLLAAVEKEPAITLLFESDVVQVETSHAEATVILGDGQVCKAPLLLAADGRFSKTREMLGMKARVVEYGQTAMVSTIRHTKPHQGVALERFLPAGPFAVLPMQGKMSGVVWSEPHDVAEMMMQLDDRAYAQEIEQRAGEYLGKITMDGERFAYPLGLVLAHTYITKRAALIGDSAHAIHPIAGQGVNLGYRDVAVLAELLGEAHRLGLDIGGASVLERYQRWRRGDIMSMIAATDGINRLFSNDLLPLRLARRLGLAMVERSPRLKSYFMFHAMGLTGELPGMLKRDAA